MKYNLNFVYNKQRKLLQDASNESLFIQKPLGCVKYDDAYVIPHCGGDAGVVTKDLLFIPSTGFEGFEKSSFDGTDALYVDDKAIYMGCFHWVWGHYYTDNIKRFWFLYTEEGQNLIKDGARLVYTCICNKSIGGNGAKLMSMADVDVSKFDLITHPTQFQELYVPEPSMVHFDLSQLSLGKRLFTNEYKETIQRIRVKIEKTICYPKVYFSRTGLTNNYLREYGEWEIERVFKKKGYRIIRPETLSLEDQLSILSHCTHFAAAEGSISHNVIFCNPGTEVTIIRKANYINYYQLVINEIADLNVTYIDAHHTTPPYGDGHVWFGPFYMCKTFYLLKWANQPLLFLPFWLKPSYWWYEFSRIKFVKKWLSNRKFVHELAKSHWARMSNTNFV